MRFTRTTPAVVAPTSRGRSVDSLTAKALRKRWAISFSISYKPAPSIRCCSAKIAVNKFFIQAQGFKQLCPTVGGKVEMPILFMILMIPLAMALLKFAMA